MRLGPSERSMGGILPLLSGVAEVLMRGSRGVPDALPLFSRRVFTLERCPTVAVEAEAAVGVNA